MDHLTFFVMGSKDAPKGVGNHWTSLPDWPTPTTTRFYMQPGGALATSPAAVANASSSFAYDPSDPSPTTGGNNLVLKCGPKDQAPVEARAGDHLTFTTAPLAEPLALTGALEAELYVRRPPTQPRPRLPLSATPRSPPPRARLPQD